MDPGSAVLMTFLSLGLIGAGITRMWFAHEERKIKLRSQSQTSVGNDSLVAQMETLREELARLRDTSTQYDVSIQHTLEDMQQRLARLESKRSGITPPTVEETSQPTVGLGNK